MGTFNRKPSRTKSLVNMDLIKNKYTPWQRLKHIWKARRDVPFRKKFFVGYDLHGNTYWEFTPDGNQNRLRRILHPYKRQFFEADYYPTIPPQWLQWLRRTRPHSPTLEELVNDQLRQQKMYVLSQYAEEKWSNEKKRLEAEHQEELNKELGKPEGEHEKEKEQPANDEKNPWAEADAKAKTNADSIATATIKPRKK